MPLRQRLRSIHQAWARAIRSVAVLAGAVAKEYHKGSEDGQWSEGLVSAAKLVASAAHSLCDLLDRLRTTGKWDRDGIKVHIQALRLLRTLPPGEETAAAERFANGSASAP